MVEGLKSLFCLLLGLERQNDVVEERWSHEKAPCDLGTRGWEVHRITRLATLPNPVEWWCGDQKEGVKSPEHLSEVFQLCWMLVNHLCEVSSTESTALVRMS